MTTDIKKIKEELKGFSQVELPYDIKKDTRVYYQITGRKGTLKLKKEWADALPLIYMMNRWSAYDTINDWFVK